jgi:nucleotide-binding universal stress UspA family protein
VGGIISVLLAIFREARFTEHLTNPKKVPLATTIDSVAIRSKECHAMTALRDILVVLDDTARSEMRLAIAIRLAKQHDAHLTGISALDLVTPPGPVARFYRYPEIDPRGGSELMTGTAVSARDYPQVETGVAEKTEQIEAAFRIQLRSSGLRGDWHVADGKLSEALAFHARHADLVILGQADQNRPSTPASRHLVDDTLMTAGRPILVIPYAGQFETVGTKVLIGWNNSREVARAVNDALPVLAKAASVTILEAYPVGRMPVTHDAASSGITRHLAHHGITAKTARTVMTNISAADTLLSYAAETSADLLVVGGYGHSRLRELILGGVTRELLQHMTVPVLMSH